MKKHYLLLAAVALITTSLNAQNGGYALKLDGVDDYAEIQHSSTFNVSQYTIELWFYWDSPSVTNDVQFLIAKATEQLEIHTGGGGGDKGLRFIPTTGVYFDTGANAFEPNSWNHVAFAFNPSTSYYKCYINGIEKILTKNGVNPITTPIIQTSSPINIGKRSDNTYKFKGKIDEVRLWNTLRTEAEINANMNREIGPDANLIAYYKMSNGTGSSITDNSENNNTGSVYNGTAWALSGAMAGARNALNFDGIDDHVAITHNEVMNVSQYTAEMWFYWDNPSALNAIHFLMGKGVGQLEIHTGGDAGSKGLRFLPTPGVYFDTEINSFETNSWNHIAFSYNPAADHYKCYINGIEKQLTKTGTVSPIVTTTNPLLFGKRGDGNFPFKGKIDEVRLWNYTRSAGEIAENAFKNVNPAEPGLVAYYRMDEHGTVIYDQTPNANNGTLSNMTNANRVASTAFNTWLGGESNAMGTAANWSSGTSPSSADNIGIYKWNLGNELAVNQTLDASSLMVSANSNPTINAALNTVNTFVPLRNIELKAATTNTLGSMSISTGIELSVPADAKINISKTLTNKGKIILKSNDNNSAQLINTGTATNPGNVIVRKQLKASSEWNFVSFPFEVTLENIKISSNQNIATIGNYRTTKAPYENLYIIEYNGNRRDQTGTTAATNSPNWDAVVSGPLTAGKGYALRTMSDIELDFIGSTNLNLFTNADKTVAVGNQNTNASPIHHGWNLAGIPFTTGFDISRLSQGTFLYVYDQTNKTYLVKERLKDNYTLPPFSSFFIQASSTSLNFATTGRVLKAPAPTNEENTSEIVLALSNGSYTDQTAIRFQEDATEAYDLNKDAAKFLSMNISVPQLWSKAQTFDVAINALPKTVTEITLGLRLGLAGEYSLQLTNPATDQHVLLMDSYTNTMIDLSKEKTYTFSSELSGTVTDRFKIVTNSDITTKSDKTSQNRPTIINYENGFAIDGLTGMLNLTITDMTGKTVATFTNLSNRELCNFQLKGGMIFIITDRTSTYILKNFGR